MIPFPGKRLLKSNLLELAGSEAFQRVGHRIVTVGKYDKWKRENPCPAFGAREALFGHILETEKLSGPIQYLEFGVYRGDSLRWWVEHNADPGSSFVGFDSFRGLPEEWAGRPQGFFSTDGELPVIADPRCSFQKGLFQDTLPTFLEMTSMNERLVVHLDADLFSSTLFVLISLAPRLKPGDVLIFDEMSIYMHEFRAFESFLKAYPVETTCVGHCNDYEQVGLRVGVRRQ